MPVDDQSTVDAIGVEPSSGSVVLTISDHLDWQDVRDHLSHLQAKLNAYVAFIESGELLSEYPDASERPVRVDVVFRSEPTPEGLEFLAVARTTIERAGIGLSWRTLDDD